MEKKIIASMKPDDYPKTIRFYAMSGKNLNPFPFSTLNPADREILQNLKNLGITKFDIIGLNGVCFENEDDFILAKMAFL